MLNLSSKQFEKAKKDIKAIGVECFALEEDQFLIYDASAASLKKINASKFLNELGNPYYYMAKDTTGKQSVNFGIYGIPESILINNETIVLKKFVGPLNEQNLNDIKEIINSL